MKRITFRVPDELFAEAERRAAAAGESVGIWTRKLIEKETGIHIEVKIGIAGASERTRKRVEKARRKGITKRSRKPKGPPNA